MKTINLELSKRLAPYLEDVDTEYSYYFYKDDNWKITNSIWKYKHSFVRTKIFYITEEYKTLTLEEAIEFLPIKILKDWVFYKYSIETEEANEDEVYYKRYWIIYYDTSWLYRDKFWNDLPWWNTLLEAIEKILEYLLDNNLLWKKD